MDSIIRKISIGPDPNNQLHISIKSIMAGKKIHAIINNAPNSYEVWQEQINPKGITLWKRFENMPITVELDTRFS